VAYAAPQLNILKTMAINQLMLPKVLFLGAQVYFTKVLSLAFRNNCKVVDGMDNSSCSHMAPCIALYPCENVTGL